MSEYVKPAFLIFFIIIVPGVIGGIMAANRGRSVFAWCLLSALLPPSLLYLYFAGPLSEVEGVFRRCLKCGKLIKWRDQVCKYCQSVRT